MSVCALIVKVAIVRHVMLTHLLCCFQVQCGDHGDSFDLQPKSATGPSGERTVGLGQTRSARVLSVTDRVVHTTAAVYCNSNRSCNCDWSKMETCLIGCVMVQLQRALASGCSPA